MTPKRAAATKATQAPPEEPDALPAVEALEAGDPLEVLQLLRAELGHAIRKRAAATAARAEAMEARWSSRIESLAKLIERIAPPPPPSPDLVLERLRALDGEAIAHIEMHLANPLAGADLWPNPAKVAELRTALDALPGAEHARAVFLALFPPFEAS